jgi:Uma2 family endonuclease
MPLALPTTSLKLTYEDFLGFPEDGRRHELLDGEHTVTPAPASWHQWVSANLHLLLGLYAHQHRLGRVFAAPIDVVLSDVDVVEPDLLFVTEERLGIVTAAHLDGAPDLVVEILSPGTRRRDEITKRHLYERYGVAEYWLVDPELLTVQVFRRVAGRYDQGTLFSIADRDTLGTPLMPGLALSIAEIFRR